MRGGWVPSHVRALGVDRFIRGRWVRSRAPCVSLGLSGVAGITRLYLGGRWVYPGSLGTLACSLGVTGFIRGRRVHSLAPWVSLGSSGVVGFTRARPVGHWVHSGSLVSLSDSLSVVGFIRGRWGDSDAL